jgi:hypothetical protein
MFHNPFSIASSHLSLRSLEQLDMLSRMRLLDIRPGHLLHHKVGIDIHLLNQRASRDTPLSRDSQHTNRRLSVDERVYAFGDVGQSEFVCSLQKC